MKKYVCFLERDHWSSLNSLWAVICEHDFIPDSVLILSRYNDPKPFSKNLRSLISAYGGDVDIEVKQTSDASDARKVISSSMSDSTGTIVLDITGGSKDFLVSILVDRFSHNFDNVFYLSSSIPIDSAYPVLDQTKIRLVDLLEG